MGVASFVIPGHVVCVRSDNHTGSSGHFWGCLTAQEHPGGKRIVESPVVPASAKQRWSLNQSTQVGRIRNRNSVAIVRDFLAEDRGQEFHLDDADVVCAGRLLDEFSALSTSHAAVALPEPALGLGWR